VRRTVGREGLAASVSARNASSRARSRANLSLLAKPASATPPSPPSEGQIVGRITALVAHPRRAGRYRVEVEGNVVGVVDAEGVGTLKLRVGVAYDDVMAAGVALSAARVAAYDKALECLARGAKSTKDLARWLTQREHARENVTIAIERLTELGLLNDAEFARSFARSRATGRGMSRWRIQAELAKRGVARDLVDAAISEVMSDESIDERAMVEAAAAKKFRSLQKLEPDVQRRRLYGFLARKGYPPDLVGEIVKRLTRPAA
jgi:regulatory protein